MRHLFKMEEETKQIIREIVNEGDCRHQHGGSFEDFIKFLQSKYSDAWLK